MNLPIKIFPQYFYVYFLYFYKSAVLPRFRGVLHRLCVRRQDVRVQLPTVLHARFLLQLQRLPASGIEQLVADRNNSSKEFQLLLRKAGHKV